MERKGQPVVVAAGERALNGKSDKKANSGRPRRIYGESVRQNA